MMESKEFAALALQLLEAANIPGAALEQAIKFKRTAEAIQLGAAEIQAAEMTNAKGDDLEANAAQRKTGEV
jgi:hypothetical protein